MEAVQEANITEEEAEESFNKLMSGKFNLKDMYDVWEKFAQPGLLRRILDNMPLARSPPLASRVGQADIEGATQKLQRYRVILDSMTFEELENPDILNSKRIQRVARGGPAGRNPR